MTSLMTMIDPSAYGIGMPVDRVVLLPHDPRWLAYYEAVAEVLHGHVAHIHMHHVGSTVVPGLPAKPILDVLGVTTSIDIVDEQRHVFEALGGEWRGEYGLPGRRFVVFRSADNTRSVIHVHMWENGHADVRRHLQFRDTLLRRDDLRDAYAALKASLASAHLGDREAYTNGKADFIMRVLDEELP